MAQPGATDLVLATVHRPEVYAYHGIASLGAALAGCDEQRPSSSFKGKGPASLQLPASVSEIQVGTRKELPRMTRQAEET
jgi:hypothetical protein